MQKFDFYTESHIVCRKEFDPGHLKVKVILRSRSYSKCLDFYPKADSTEFDRGHLKVKVILGSRSYSKCLDFYPKAGSTEFDRCHLKVKVILRSRSYSKCLDFYPKAGSASKSEALLLSDMFRRRLLWYYNNMLQEVMTSIHYLKIKTIFL